MKDGQVVPAGKRVLPGEPPHGEICEFLLEEAELLDNRRFQEWLLLLTEDIRYRMPARLNVRHNSEQPDHSEISELFSDNLASLTVRVSKLGTEYAWAETPASRTRHFVSNIRVRSTDRPDEMQVSSYLLLYRNQGSRPDADIFSGERQDILRHVNGSWRLASRTILLDQAVLSGGHMPIFF